GWLTPAASGGSARPSAFPAARDTAAGCPAHRPPPPACPRRSGATSARLPSSGASTAARSGPGSASKPAGVSGQTSRPRPSSSARSTPEGLGVLIPRVIQVDPEILRPGMLAPHQREQLDHALRVQVLARVAPAQVLHVVGAARPEGVQPLAAPADADLETLPCQQPAVGHHLQPVQRVHAVDEMAAPAVAARLLLVLLVVGDGLLLLVLVGLEEGGAGLVEGAAQPHQQLAHAAGGEPSTEGRLDPLAHLGGAPEAPRGGLLL